MSSLDATAVTYQGRSSYPGPTNGNVIYLSFDTTSTVGADVTRVKWRAGFDGRIYFMSAIATALAGTPTWGIENDTTGLPILSARALTGTRDHIYTGINVVPRRDFSKDDVIAFEYTCAGGESITRGYGALAVGVRGFVHINPAEDV